jgi:hypothetical protein
MSSTTPEPARSQPTTVPPFADIVAELSELGFEPSPRPVEPGRVLYTATDSPVTVTLAPGPGCPHVHIDCPADGQHWYLSWAAGTPWHVQLIALYGVLNDDPTAALGAAAASLRAAPPDQPAGPYPAG